MPSTAGSLYSCLLVLLMLAAYGGCIPAVSGEAKQDLELVKLERSFGRLAALDYEAAAKLPAEILYMMQAEILSRYPGEALAKIARKHKDDAAVVGKTALAARSLKQKEEFLNGLREVVFLPERVQRELAACMVHWFRDLDSDWDYERFVSAIVTGSPLLAYLPLEFIYHLDRNNRNKFLYHLRAWTWTISREAEWARKPRGLKRSWAEIMVGTSFAIQEFQVQDILPMGFVLTGALPDELLRLPLKLSRDVREAVLRLHLDHLQARAVFQASFHQYKPGVITVPSDQVRNLLPILPLLTPVQLHCLNTARVNISALGTEPLRTMFKPSWASARQLAFTLIEQAEIFGDVANVNDSATWGLKGLHYIAHWVYSLPAKTLSRLFENNPTLLDNALRQANGNEIVRTIDMSPLSPRQARIILASQVGNEFCEDNSTASVAVQGVAQRLNGRLLLALPARCVAMAPVSNLSQSVLVSLLSNLSPDSPAAFPLYLKLWAVLDRDWVLNAMLENADPGGFLKLIAAPDIAPIAQDLYNAIDRHSLSTTLPRRQLGLILGHWRRARETLDQSWKGALLKVPALLPGLRCQDLRHMGREEGLTVLSRLGQYLQDAGAQYPRDLQHCGLKALEEYMVTRAQLQERSGMPLLDMLEPAEMDAIGGYVFARIPASILNASGNWKHLVRAVGRLSVPELLEVFSAEENGTTKAAELAKMVLERVNPEIHGLATLELLGNLLQFVPYTEHLAPKLDSRAFRLWIEGLERPTDTALCVPHIARAGFWNRAIIDAYGLPSNWSAGTLGNLGGFLAALSSVKLNEIPQTSWTQAADVLNANNGYTWQFIQICTKFLGPGEEYRFSARVKVFSRRLMDASRNLSSTVQAPREMINLATPVPTKASTVLQSSKLSGVKFDVLPARDRRFVDSRIIHDDEKSADQSFILARAVASVAEPNILIPVNSPIPSNSNSFLNTTLVPPPKERKLRCGTLRMSSVAATLLLDESDLKALLATDELIECLEFLGSLELPALTTTVLWRIIKSEDISVDIREMGYLLSQVDVDTLKIEDLKDLDTVTALGRYMDNWDEVSAVTQLVLEANDVSERISDELGGALGRLTCGLFDKELQKYAHQLLRPDLLMKISAVLIAALESSPRCPPAACLKGLAEIMSGPMVMGDPITWNYEDVSGLGVIVSGLTPKQIKKLQAKEDFDSVRGLTADSMRCMPLETLNEFSEEQLRSLSVTALHAISQRQFQRMLPSLQDAVLAARSPPLPEHLSRNVSSLSIYEKESERADKKYAVSKCSTVHSKMDPRLLMLIVFYAVSIMLNRISF